MRITFARNGAVIINGKRTSFYVRQGAYQGTTDDRLGRWYSGDTRDDFFRPWGAGHQTRMGAAMAALGL